MSSLYFAADDKNKNKLCAHVMEVPRNTNLAHYFTNFPYLEVAHLCRSRKEAENVVTAWNEIHRQNGEYGFQEPDGTWDVYDPERECYLRGEEALTKVIDDNVKGRNEMTVCVDDLDLSDDGVIQHGYYGHAYEVEWSVTRDGTLYIYGKDIPNLPTTPPWMAFDLKRAVISCDSIAAGAFMGKMNVPELEINCERIYSGAFCFNDTVQSLHLLVGQIDDKAFAGCEKLEEVSLNCLYVMWPHAFADCPALEYVHISGEIDTIEDGSFMNCYNLKTVTIEGNTDVDISNHAIPAQASVIRDYSEEAQVVDRARVEEPELSL